MYLACLPEHGSPSWPHTEGTQPVAVPAHLPVLDFSPAGEGKAEAPQGGAKYSIYLLMSTSGLDFIVHMGKVPTLLITLHMLDCGRLIRFRCTEFRNSMIFLISLFFLCAYYVLGTIII